jgi:hypothetical protein
MLILWLKELNLWNVIMKTPYTKNNYFNRPGSSGSIVSDYVLDDRAIGVRSPAGTKDFSSSLCVQTGSGAHPASPPMGTGGPFPGAKRGRGVTLTTHPRLVPKSRMSRSYTSSPPKRHHGVQRDCFAFFLVFIRDKRSSLRQRCWHWPCVVWRRVILFLRNVGNHVQTPHSFTPRKIQLILNTLALSKDKLRGF